MTRSVAMEGWRTNDEVIANELRRDPGFRAEWERTSLGRAVATALVRYRADHDLSPGDLAALVGVCPGRVALLEIGDTNPNDTDLLWLSARLGIEPRINPAPSHPAE